MSSPRCRIVGFDASDVGEIWEREDGMVEGGAGRPESCGVGVAADIIMVKGCDVIDELGRDMEFEKIQCAKDKTEIPRAANEAC
jgi:hypothetical protein